MWFVQFGTLGDDHVLAVDVDDAGHAYLAGYTNGAFPGETNTGGWDAFVAKFHPGGTHIWSRQLGTQDTDALFDIIVGRDGRTYAVGLTRGSFPGEENAGGIDAFAVSYWPDGTLAWLRQFGTDEDDFAISVSEDDAGTLAVTGSTFGDFSGRTATEVRNTFFAGFNMAGTMEWITQFGTTAHDYVQASAAAAGNLYVTGFTEGTFPDQKNHGGIIDAFLSKWQVCEIGNSCLGDLDGDGIVGHLDLMLLALQWGLCGAHGPCVADLNDDGRVDMYDIVILLSNWGQCTNAGHR